MLLVPLFAQGFRKKDTTFDVQQPKNKEIMESIKIVFGRKSYVLLLGGFFVCGFHVSFITNHFPAYLTDSGISAENAAWAVSLIGPFQRNRCLCVGSTRV